MLIRSRLVIPICQPPIENGAVRVEGNRIAAVGRWADLRTGAQGEVADLGDSIVLPGLINAHCHLDYTEMAGLIPPPKSFPDWIKALLALKAAWSYSDYAQSWLQGARMLRRSGVTTVGDIEAVPELLPEVWSATPLRIISFLEMTGIRRGRSPAEILRETIDRIDSLSSERSQTGLSPHAPYSTSPELLRRSSQIARERGWRVATHVAESEPEFEMFMNRRGPLFEWLKAQRNMNDCGMRSPVQHLHSCGLLTPRFLAIHVNYLAPGDADLLAQAGASVVHCPQSHFYFRHQPFPFEELSRAGVNVCLGTDSLASVVRRPKQKVHLSLFAEMQRFAAHFPSARPQQILEMVTRNAAKSLGFEGCLGELSSGALADLIALQIRDPARDPYESIIAHSSPPSAVMIDGIWHEKLPTLS